MATQPPVPGFTLLSDEEFKALTTEGRIEYLKRAIKYRNKLNEQIEQTLLAKGKLEKK